MKKNNEDLVFSNQKKLEERLKMLIDLLFKNKILSKKEFNLLQEI